MSSGKAASIFRFIRPVFVVNGIEYCLVLSFFFGEKVLKVRIRNWYSFGGTSVEIQHYRSKLCSLL